MKFASTLTVITLAAAASAQRSYIRYPTNGTTVHPGKTITLQLVRPNSLQGSQEVGLALSFEPCTDNGCPNPALEVGTVLNIKRFNPELHEIPGNPYQNFSLKIPIFDWMQPGRAQLISTRLHLIGAGPSPVLETNAVEVNIAN